MEVSRINFFHPLNRPTSKMKYGRYFIVQMSRIRYSGKEVEENTASVETTEGINQIRVWIKHCRYYLKQNALGLFLKTTEILTINKFFPTYLLHK